MPPHWIRDLKPENILFESEAEDANIKVIDFGTSIIYREGQKMDAPYGTVSFIHETS